MHALYLAASRYIGLDASTQNTLAALRTVWALTSPRGLLPRLARTPRN